VGEALSFPVFDYDSWPGREIINVLGYPISQKRLLLDDKAGTTKAP